MSLKSVNSKLRPITRMAKIQHAYLERLISEKLGLRLEKWFRSIRQNPAATGEKKTDESS